MRPEFDNEIDSVLRGHARRGGALPAAWDAVARPSISGRAQSGTHLDADEIAAFGEDALPAAARARYATHLADCDDCRRSVTQVAFAAGVADRINERAGAAAGVAGRAEEQARAAAAGAYATQSPSAATRSSSPATQTPSWRERLSSIFAPRAWRYAMPVVALFAVGAVVFVLMNDRLREGASEMARQGGSAGQRASTPAVPEGSEAHHGEARQQQPDSLAKAQPGETGTTAGVAPANENNEDAAAGGESAKLRAKVVEGADQSAPVVTSGAGVAQTETVQVTSAEPAPPPAVGNYATAATPIPVSPPAAAPASRTMIARDGILQPSPPPPVAEQEMRARAGESSPARAAPRDEAPATPRHGPQRSAAGRSAELSSSAEAMKDDRAASRRARAPAKSEANRNEPDESKAKREEDRGQQEQQRAETRTVAGRRFRREGSVWIDTAYRSGQATVVMRRGSEQYRTLVADAPEIGNVSRTFNSEVVVVWKGRAYRIKQ